MDKDLVGVLEEHVDPEKWQADVNNLAIRLKATMADTLQDEEGAFLAARSFRDAITSLGYVIYGSNSLGVVSVHSTEGEVGKPGAWPVTGWRGTVELCFTLMPA